MAGSTPGARQTARSQLPQAAESREDFSTLAALHSCDLKPLEANLAAQPKGRIHAARAPKSTISVPQAAGPHVDPVYHSVLLPAT